MKRCVATLFLLALPLAAAGGELLPGYIETGGYGTVAGWVSQLGNSESGVFLGVGGGLLFDRRVSVGAELMILVDDVPYRTQAGDDRFIEYKTASLELGYIFWPRAIVHPALTVDAGLGWLRLRNPDQGADEPEPDSDMVFQARPAAHVVLNLTRTARLSLSGGYRWVSGIDTEDFLDQDAEGAFGEVSVSFGAF